MLLLSVVAACGRAHGPASSRALEPRTSASKHAAPASAATPATPPSVSSEGGEPEGQPDPLISAVQPEPPDLAERHRVERGAPAGRARLVIRNTYLTVQYVFVAGEFLGFVPPDTEGSFDIPPGAHGITISDSRDGESNSKSLSEVFDSGYSYHYDVVAR